MARTAGNKAGWVALLGLATVALGQPWGCNGGDPDDTGDTLGLSDMLAAVGPEVVLPALARFRVELAALDAALAAWGTAQASGDADAARLEAQAAWRGALSVWQELEVMQIGPAASSLTAIGGQDIRDQIYSWPSVNACRVDQEIVAAEWEEPTFFEDNLVNVMGLDAIEHLVYGGADNACAEQVDINLNGTWAALGEAAVNTSRVAYARVLVAEIDRLAAELETAWSPEGGDFSGALVADTEATPYAGQQEALDAVFHAMFYLELVTKDRKLAQPLGLAGCATATCPLDVEGLESGTGAASIAGNLRGFRALFTGGSTTGMDDLLVDLGHEALTTEILADIDAALVLADGMSLPLDQAVETDPPSVEALHAAVKAVTDDLKGDVATVLVLTIPSEASGDND